MTSIKAIRIEVEETIATARTLAANGNVSDANLTLTVMCDILNEYIQETITPTRYVALQKMWCRVDSMTSITDLLAKANAIKDFWITLRNVATGDITIIHIQSKSMGDAFEIAQNNHPGCVWIRGAAYA